MFKLLVLLQKQYTKDVSMVMQNVHFACGVELGHNSCLCLSQQLGNPFYFNFF